MNRKRNKDATCVVKRGEVDSIGFKNIPLVYSIPWRRQQYFFGPALL